MSPILDPSRGLLSLEGEESRKFLQGMVSADVYTVNTKQAVYTAHLSPQGKFLDDFFIFQPFISQPNCLWVDIESERIAPLIKRLRLYKLRANCEINPIQGYTCVLDLEGQISTNIGFNDPRHKGMGRRLWFQKPEEAFNDDMGPYEQKRIKFGLPKAGQDIIRERDTLLDRGMDAAGAISWNKGCYMGQEVTARMKYRALLKRRLSIIKTGSTKTAVGDPLFIGEMKVGRITSLALPYGLAILDNIALDNTSLLTASGNSIKILCTP